MGYRIIVFLNALLLSVRQCHADVNCYKCTPFDSQYNASHNYNSRACSDFDKTDEFKTRCLYSTFCLKKTSEYTLDNETIRLEERRCAVQTSPTDVPNGTVFVKDENVDTTVYTNGCHHEPNAGLRSIKMEYCYCSSDYCNTSQRSSDTTFFHYTHNVSVIFIFNVVKFIRSIR